MRSCRLKIVYFSLVTSYKVILYMYGTFVTFSGSLEIMAQALI
jgi:hypothetical protein